MRLTPARERLGAVFLITSLWVGLVPSLTAQSTPTPDGGSSSAGTEASPTAAPPQPTERQASEDGGDSAAADRTKLNLLGEVDSESGEGRRNENVRLTLIDNNVLKELNTRMGTTASVVERFHAEREYFGREFGGSPSTPLHLGPTRSGNPRVELFWGHANSALSARSYFQVGGVQPSRTNDYGLTLFSPLGSATSFTVNASQRKLRGQVNGNILVPAADERTPTTRDPARLAIVQAILGSYPDQLPNRTDINPRALNTNARQNIDNDRADATFDHSAGDDRLTARYNVTLQQVEAFQLVGGQNPDTTTKSHRARLTWGRAWNASTTTDFSAGFERVGSLIVPEETSLGPFYLFGRTMQSIGPSSSFPIDRAQNTFRYAGRAKAIRGNHTWDFGGEVARRQINGFESNDHRGTFSFRRDFGRNTAENLLEGTPSAYRVALGSAHRGFRVWNPAFFVTDDWRVDSRLSLTVGLRYAPRPRPAEVDGLSEVPYDCDCNNFAPRFGFAYQAHERWGVLRGAYGIHYGEIFGATFMQSRFNTPGVLSLNLAVPDVADPLANLTPEQLDPNGRSTFFRIDPELSTPYSHQYNFAWQMRPAADWMLEWAYVGSRSPKLLQQWYLNRARTVEGIESTTANVNERRPDPRYFDLLHTLNGSRGYYDAGKVTLRIPRWAGLSLETSYWFSKAIDLGANYTNTSFGRDGRSGRSPSEFDVHGLMKGPSDFDQSHAALWRVNYETPGLARAPGWARSLFSDWQFSSVVLAKSGTPVTVRINDSPGAGNVDGAGSDRPNVLDPSVLGAVVDDPDTSRQRLPRSAFGPIAVGAQTGNLGAATFRKDGPFNVNAALSRRFTLGGDRFMLFRFESLNLLNHPQFAEPGVDLAAENFAQITNTLNEGRAFRLNLRLVF